MVYVALTSFLFLIRLSLLNRPIELRQIYYFIILALFLFSAFRYQVGCDWIAYENMFLYATGLDWKEALISREPIFWMILKLLHKINLTYPYINIVSSIIFFIGVHVLARRQPDPLGFLVLMFPFLIINMPMSGIRQGAAIGLLCIAIVAFIDRRPLSFLIWIILATGIHTSAIIFIILLPFASGRFNNTRLAIVALLVLPTAIFFYFLESTQWALKTYVGSGREAYGAAFRVAFLSLSGVYFFLCLKNKWFRTFPKDYSIVSLGSMGMVMIAILIPISSIIGDRVGYYLIPIQAMIFARIPYLPFKLNHSIHSILPYLALFAVFTVWTQSSWIFKLCYNPYGSWLLGLPN